MKVLLLQARVQGDCIPKTNGSLQLEGGALCWITICILNFDDVLCLVQRQLDRNPSIKRKRGSHFSLPAKTLLAVNRMHTLREAPAGIFTGLMSSTVKSCGFTAPVLAAVMACCVPKASELVSKNLSVDCSLFRNTHSLL